VEIAERSRRRLAFQFFIGVEIVFVSGGEAGMAFGIA
jgi:hypothetical protein